MKIDLKNSWGIFLELYPDSVFRFGIGRYFPGIFPTDTEGKLGRDILVLYILREPLFPSKGGLCPLFDGSSPPVEGKISSRQIFKKEFPQKYHKMELPPNLTVQKIPNRISMTGKFRYHNLTDTDQTARQYGKQMEYNSRYYSVPQRLVFQPFFLWIKGWANFLPTTPVHKKRDSLRGI